MKDLRRITILAVVLLIVLRISIGWQFLYEGLWKLGEQKSARPWSSAGFLRNAKGPFRDTFRNLTGDPDELSWLDHEAVAARWDAWHERFKTHYSDLNDAQTKQLDELINGKKTYTVPLKILPKKVKFGKNLKKAVHYDAEQKLLVVDGNWHLTPREKALLLKMVPIPSKKNKREYDIAVRFRRAVANVDKDQSRLSYKEQLRASLLGDPQRAGKIDEKQKGTIDYKRPGQIELYRDALERYESNLESARQDFQHAHLTQNQGEIRELRAQLIGPVKALDSHLKQHARKLLTVEQLAKGPVPPASTRMSGIDTMTVWLLIVLGSLLIVGLGTRVAALAGAGMLLSFYLAYPPWPGVPQSPGPEHSLFINQNLIEVFALLSIAMLPTGSWFGIDGLCRRAFRRRSAAAPTRQAAADKSPKPTAPPSLSTPKQTA